MFKLKRETQNICTVNLSFQDIFFVYLILLVIYTQRSSSKEKLKNMVQAMQSFNILFFPRLYTLAGVGDVKISTGGSKGYS